MTQKLKLLIVDDEDGLRSIMKDELTNRGYDVTDAEGGQAALDKLKSESFDVIILDVRMPDIDGLDVLRQLRQTNTTSRVIMLTGVDELKIAKDSLALGADDFMTKPFQFQNLIACIDRVMKGQ